MSRRGAGDAPIVDGLECSRGHFNRPGTRYCVICGTSMRQGARPARGRRPPLGVLLTGTGSLPLNSDVVIGADPERYPDVSAGRAVGLRIEDSGAVADAHARIAVRDWVVELYDLGTGSGTRVLHPGSGEWSEVDTSVPVKLEPGTTVQLGAATIEYRDRREHE